MLVRPSAVFLIAANAIPLVGVLFFDWRVFDILLLYWTESVIVGLVNVLKMATNQSNAVVGLSHGKTKFFLIPFFAVHFGGFCAGHLFAILSIFGDAAASTGSRLSLVEVWRKEYWVAVTAIAASHLFSYFSNYIGKEEYRNLDLRHLMQRPYGRIIVLQVVVILGAGLVSWAGSPLPMLILLVIAKTVLDLRAHAKERRLLVSQI